MSNPSAPAGNGVMGQMAQAGMFNDPSFIAPEYGGTFGQGQGQAAPAPAPLASGTPLGNGGGFPERAPEPAQPPLGSGGGTIGGNTESAFSAIVDSALGSQPTQAPDPAPRQAQQSSGGFFGIPRGGSAPDSSQTASNRESIF